MGRVPNQLSLKDNSNTEQTKDTGSRIKTSKLRGSALAAEPRGRRLEASTDLTPGLASGLLSQTSGHLPGDISEDSWDLKVCQDLRIHLLLLPKPHQGEGYDRDPNIPMLEPISDELLLMPGLWDRNSVI